MNSSRMRTVRNRSRLLGRGVPALGGAWSGGEGGLPGPGGVVSEHALRQPPLWTDRQV